MKNKKKFLALYVAQMLKFAYYTSHVNLGNATASKNTSTHEVATKMASAVSTIL